MSANWFDHAIASVAPRTAARRVLARQAFETLTRRYDGAAKGRRTEGWRAPGTSADTQVGVAGALLRDRMRDLVRNNPHAAKAVAVLVVYLIGCFGVTVFFNVPMNEALAGMNLSEDTTRAYWTGTYLPRWTFWNTVRTLACGVSAALLLFGLLWMTQAQVATLQAAAR